MVGRISTGLLEKPADPGYPVDYLLSRVRSRRSQLVRDWARLVDADMEEFLSTARLRGMTGEPLSLAFWQRLLREYRWVYHQMNGRLRKVFRPFFLYSELRTIFICMRQGKKARSPGVDTLLALSLLCDPLKKALVSGSDLAITARRIEDAFICLSDDFQGIADTSEAHGLREFETRLAERYLAFAHRTVREHFMRCFLARLIDARNLIKAYKSLRLNAKLRPEWISGGYIPTESLDAVVQGGDVLSVLPLIRRYTGTTIATPEIRHVEGALYRGISRYLRTEAADPLGLATLLDYLWRIALETTNLSLLLHGRDVPRDVMTEELVH